MFELKKHGTTVRTEIIAGLTTFAAMAYILMVNPGMFANLDGVSFDAVYIATALSAVIGTVLIGLTKPVIKAHGSSDALAFRNAVKQAAQAAQNDMTPELEQALRLLAEAKEQTND